MINGDELEESFGKALIRVTFQSPTQSFDMGTTSSTTFCNSNYNISNSSRSNTVEVQENHSLINDKSKECIITLCKILDNILREKEYNPKTRSIKLSNRLFHERVGNVPGAIDFLLACNFAFVAVHPSSRNKQRNSKNAIQLTKEKENRIVLLFGRIYLHKFGKYVLSLDDTKNKNELPPLKGFRDITEHSILQNVGHNIEVIVRDAKKRGNWRQKINSDEANGSQTDVSKNDENSINGGSIKSTIILETNETTNGPLIHKTKKSEILNDESSIEIKENTQQDGDQRDGNGCISQNNTDQCEEGIIKSLPKTSEESGAVTTDHNREKHNDSESFLCHNSAECSSSSPENKDANACIIDKSASMKSVNHIDNTHTETIERQTSDKSHHTSSSDIDNIESGFDIISLNSMVDPRYTDCDPKHESIIEVENFDIGSDLLKKGKPNTDDESVSSFATGLTIEEKEAFDNLSRYGNLDSNVKSENDMILSVLDDPLMPDKYKSDNGLSWLPFNRSDVTKTDNNDDLDSVASHGSLSIIHIKNSTVFDAKSKPSNIHSILERDESISCDDDIPQEYAKYSIDNVELPSQLSQDESNTTRLALKLFFSIFVLVSHYPGEFFSGEYKILSFADEEGIWFPIEIYYLLWIDILQNEDHEDQGSVLKFDTAYNTLKKAAFLGSHGEKLGQLYCLISGEDIRICNFISTALSNLNLLKVTHGNAKGNSYLPRKDSPGTMIRLNKQSGRVYGEKLAKQNFTTFKQKSLADANYLSSKEETSILSHMQAQWHGILVKVVYEKMGFALENTKDGDPISTANPVLVWYSARVLPLHLVKTELWRDTKRLLLDKRFLQYRYTSCGVIDGTKLYIQESLLFSNIAESRGELNGTDEFKEALYGLIRAFLLEEKMLLVQSTKDTKGEENTIKQKATDFSDALYCLGAAFGKDTGRYTDEIDLYNESLRLKKAFNSENLNESVAEILVSMGACYFNMARYTEAMAHYTEAKCIYNDLLEGNHKIVSRILYSIGIINFELGDFQESLDSFKESLTLIQNQSGKDNIDTICWLGRIHRERNEYNSALDCFIRARNMTESLVGKNHLDIAEILQNLGVLYDDMGKLEESLGCYQDCLRIRRNKLNDDQHEDICETLTCIANVFRRTDRTKAIQFFRSIANIRESKSLKTSSNYDLQLKAYNDLLDLMKEMLKINPSEKNVQDEIVVLNMKIGNVYERMKRYREAVAHYCKSLKIRKIKNDHKSIGSILNSLGIAHAKRGAYKKSIKCFSDALLVRKAILGAKHPDVGETLHNIGNCAAKQGVYEKAAKSYKESLDIKRLAYGNNSISTMKTLHNIGVVSEASGDIDAAISCYQDALKVRTALLGDNHLDVAFSLHSIGKIHLRHDNFDEAVDLFKRSLLIKKKHYASTHLSVGETIHQLATAILKQGKNEESLGYFKTALSIFEQELGTHIDTANVLDSLASIFESKDELDKSHRYLERALALKRAILGDDNMDVSDTLYLIGKVQAKGGDEDSLSTFKEVLRIRKKLKGKDSLGVAAVINDVGVIQLRRGNTDIAKNCFLEAIRIWKINLEDDHVFIGETLVNLGEIEQSDGNLDEAVDKLEEAQRIFSNSRGLEHLSVGFVSWKLGNLYHCNDNFKEGILAYEKALSIRRLHLNSDSIVLAETLKDLGSLHFDMSNFEKARYCLGEAMQILASESPNDIMTAETSLLLGKVMSKMKYQDEAVRYFEESLQIRRGHGLSNGDDLFVSDILFELGVTNEEFKNYDQSIEYYQQALTMRKNIIDEEDEIVANIYHNIGVIQQSKKKYECALENLGSALVIYQACLGDDHLSCAKTMNNIGIIYESMGDYDESMKYHQEALRVRKLHLSKDHLKIANSMDNIASVYQKQKRNKLALDCLKEALKIRIARLGKDHLEVATTLFGMGIIFCDLKELDKAMDSYNASLKIRIRKLGHSGIEIAQSLHNMGGVYALKQEYDDALEHWQQSLEKYREVGLMDDHHMVKCTLRNIDMAKKFILDSQVVV